MITINLSAQKHITSKCVVFMDSVLCTHTTHVQNTLQKVIFADRYSVHTVVMVTINVGDQRYARIHWQHQLTNTELCMNV